MLSRGASGLKQAMRFAIGWPTKVKIEPFSALDMEKTPALRENDRVTSSLSQSMFDCKDVEPSDHRWSSHSGGSSHSTFRDLARDQAQKADSSTGPSNSDERLPTISLATHEKTIADKVAIEAAIRHEADPGGLYGRDLIDTAGLVKNIRKRYRDSLEENQRIRDAMQIEKEEMEAKAEDEKYRLNLIILEQNERMEQDQQMREDYGEIQSKYSDLLADNQAKTTRVRELEEQTKSIRQKCEAVTNGSVEALKTADRRMEYRISCLEKKHQEELEEVRGQNVTLQKRLKIARTLQPDHKLVLLEQAKKEELSVKEDEIKELGTTIKEHEREIRYLKLTANADGEELNKITEMLSDTREALKKTEGKIARHEMEVERLKLWGKGLEDDSRSKSKENSKLKHVIDTLRVAPRNELIEAQAKNEGLQVQIKCLESLMKTMDQDLDSWEKGYAGRMGVTKMHHNGTLRGTKAESLAKALKAANDRANALQISVNTLHAENGVLQKQLGHVVHAYDPKLQEQLVHLQSENHNLSEAAGQAETLKTQWKAQLGEKLQKLEEDFANRTRELESGFDQGFESLRRLRDQWFLHKRGLEEVQNRDMVAADLRYESERQGREDRFMAAWKEKEKELQRREDDLQGREAHIVEQLRNIHSSGQNFNETKNRAENAEEVVRQLQHQLQRKENDLQSREVDVAEQLRNLQASGQNLNEMRDRAENAEEQVRQFQRKEDDLQSREADVAEQLRNLEASGQNLNEMKDRAENAEERVRNLQDQIQTAAADSATYLGWMEQKLNEEIMGLRRDLQRRSDLLNEEVSKLAQETRLLELHNELQSANCSIDFFKYEVVYSTRDSEPLSQGLYGADFYESDVRLLQAHGRPVLLAQLQAARLTLDKLRNLLSRSPIVEVDNAMSILMEPRGDENAAQPADDVFDEWNASQYPPNTRKRSGAPLGAPTYGDHDDNTAHDDWGDQQVSDGTKISTPQEISNRQRHQPKSRRNRVPAGQSHQSI